MKVLEQTANRLKLQHAPLSSWCWGGLLTLLGLVGLIYLIGFHAISARLNCRYISSVQVSCDLSQFTLVGGMQVRKLYDLHGATVIRRSSKRGSNYHIELANGANRIPLLHDTNEGLLQQEALVDQINQFLSAPTQDSLQIQQSGGFDASFLGIFLLVLMGVGVAMLRCPAVTCTFYKRLNKVVLEQNWCGRKHTIERPLDQILDVDLEEKRVKQGRVYRAVLVIAPDQRIPLHKDYTGQKQARAIVDPIQKFLSQ